MWVFAICSFFSFLRTVLSRMYCSSSLLSRSEDIVDFSTMGQPISPMMFGVILLAINSVHSDCDSHPIFSGPCYLQSGTFFCLYHNSEDCQCENCSWTEQRTGIPYESTSYWAKISCRANDRCSETQERNYTSSSRLRCSDLIFREDFAYVIGSMGFADADVVAQDYALKTSIPSVPTYEEITDNAVKPYLPDVSDYVKREELPDIPKIVTRDEIDIPNVAYKYDLPIIPDLSPYALKSDIPEIPDLSPYALKTDIPEIPEQQDLSPYALKTDLPNLAQYVTQSQLAAAILNDIEPETKSTPTENYVLHHTYLIDIVVAFGLIGLSFIFTFVLFLCSLRRVRASEVSRVYPAMEDAIVSRVISMLPPDTEEEVVPEDQPAFSPPSPPPSPPVELPPEPSPRIPLTDRTHTPPAPTDIPPEPPASPVPSESSTSIVPEEEVASQTSNPNEIVLQTFTFSVSGRKEPITVRLVQEV